MHVWVGGYTSEMGGHALGVSTFSSAPGVHADRDGDLHPVRTLELPSPTYLIVHPRQPWLFVVSEGAPSSVSSLLVQPDGGLSVLSTVPSGGDYACHLALSPDLGHVVVAHYGSGSVASFAVGPDGALGACADRRQFAGTGPDADRQEGPHAHQVIFDGSELLVADLGCDRVHRLRLDAGGRFEAVSDPVVLPAGFGPRHLVVAGDHLVVVGELSAQLRLARRTSGGWQHVRTVPTSCAAPGALVQPSALRADGDLVFVANRGVGTVAVFRLDTAGDELVPVAEFAAGGSWPRDLVLTAEQLWVANQTDDQISIFARTPLPPAAPVAVIATPSPACMLLLDAGSAR